jgi:hypothetical protein
MTIRVGLGNQFAGHDAAGARLVVHDHALMQVFAELVRDGARREIGDPAWTERHHDAHRL